MSKRSDQEYLDCDPFDGADRDVEIACREVKLVTTRVAHQCYSTDGTLHEIPAGTRARLESALVDGRWGRYYICLECLDKWLDWVAAQTGEFPR